MIEELADALRVHGREGLERRDVVPLHDQGRRHRADDCLRAITLDRLGLERSNLRQTQHAADKVDSLGNLWHQVNQYQPLRVCI